MLVICRSRPNGSHLLSLSAYTVHISAVRLLIYAIICKKFLQCKFARHFINIGGDKSTSFPPPNFLRGMTSLFPKSPPLYLTKESE